MKSFLAAASMCMFLTIFSTASRSAELTAVKQIDSRSSSLCVNSAHICRVPFFVIYGENRAKLDGQLISIAGYYVTNGEEHQLYPDKDSAIHRITERAIAVKFAPSTNKADVSLEANLYVQLRGTFRSKGIPPHFASIDAADPPQAIPTVTE